MRTAAVARELGSAVIEPPGTVVTVDFAARSSRPKSLATPEPAPAGGVGWRRMFVVALYLAAVGLLAWLAVDGWEYYRAPLGERPRLEQHWDLKPGGERGRLLGMAGATLMTAMLAYSLRKRVPWLRRLGPLGAWLDVHILFGVVGPGLIVFHTAFKVGGLVAVSFWSMVAVALSGVLGRFLYVQVPRTAAGDELTLAEALAVDEELTGELRARFGLGDRELGALDAAARGELSERHGLLRLLVSLPFESVRMRWRLRRFRRRLAHVPPPLVQRFDALVRQKALLRRRLLLWSRLRELFHYWHVLHKPFAVLMYLFMLVHVAVAWMTGYAGGFGR